MTHCNGKPPDIHPARLCMTYLNFTDFAGVYKRAHSYNLRFTPWEVSSSYPLFKYASSNWYKHIKNGEDALEDADNIYRLIKPTRPGPMDVLDAAIGYDCLWLVKFVITRSDHRMPPTITCDVLGKAARLMSPTILKYLLNISDCTITTEILRMVAKNNGWHGMAEMLLDKHPDCEITVAALQSVASNEGVVLSWWECS